MAQLIDPTGLVPPLARDLSARALEAVAASSTSIDLTPIIVYDLDTVDVSALPSLAEQFRVLGNAGWSFATTEALQRALLKEAIALHRVRGTPYAVTRALSVLGVTATYTEWWETQPQGAPYTFTITADPLNQPDGAPALDLNRWSQIAGMVNFWKNGRSAYSFQAVSSPIGMGVGISMTALGSAQETIGATFDGDAVSLSTAVSLTMGGSDTQSIGATFE